MSETKPRDVQVLPIAPETTVLRSRTWDRLKFEIEYGLQRGTTANSYIIQADKTVLFDPPGQSFTQIFLQALQQRFDVQTIDYFILGHVNPNRCETLKVLLEINPKVTIICSNPAAIALRSLLPDHDLNLMAIKGEEMINLGKGHILEFILTPSPRWPDRLCTYNQKTQILWTDKLFGAHVCGEQIFDEGWPVYSEDRRYYFDCLIAPHATQAESALDKFIPYPIELYATGHGPLVKYSLTELTTLYRQWLTNQKNQENKVVLIYASAYGNTAAIAQAIAHGVTKAGVAVETINCEYTEPETLRNALQKSTGFIIGSPTLGGHPPTQVQTALGVVLATAEKTQLAGVFGSYGWSGEAIDLLENKLRDGGYQFGFDPIRVTFKPTDTILKYCEEAGTDFAQLVKKRAKKRASRQPVSESQTAPTEQAMGRIVGSLSVVTAKKGELTNAMLASWVSQATFNPPGLTIAVAKERAIEDLMHIGDHFVLNILQEGKQLRRYFMKNFDPGQDRFAGLETETASNGAAILKDALAYLECTVQNRMECGDHWLIYATTQAGKVLDNQGITAVHHRKSGSYY